MRWSSNRIAASSSISTAVIFLVSSSAPGPARCFRITDSVRSLPRASTAAISGRTELGPRGLTVEGGPIPAVQRWFPGARNSFVCVTFRTASAGPPRMMPPAEISSSQPEAKVASKQLSGGREARTAGARSSRMRDDPGGARVRIFLASRVEPRLRTGGSRKHRRCSNWSGLRMRKNHHRRGLSPRQGRT